MLIIFLCSLCHILSESFTVINTSLKPETRRSESESEPFQETSLLMRTNLVIFCLSFSSPTKSEVLQCCNCFWENQQEAPTLASRFNRSIFSHPFRSFSSFFHGLSHGFSMAFPMDFPMVFPMDSRPGPSQVLPRRRQLRRGLGPGLNATHRVDHGADLLHHHQGPDGDGGTIGILNIV